jgi:hypothetical protein
MSIQRSSPRRAASAIVSCVSVATALAIFAVGSVAAKAQATQSAPAATASAAAKASPALIGELSKEMGASPEQAAGAAGALFGLAKSRLSPAEFSQVSNAVPGMDLLLKAAPTGGATGAAAGLSQLGASAGGLAAAANAFTKLGLKPELAAKAVPILTSFVTKSGGANVGSLLAGALK